MNRDGKLFPRLLEKVVARPTDRSRHTRCGVEKRHHRQRVSADTVREAAGLGQRFVAVLDAHQRRVDRRECLKHDGEAGNVLLGSLVLAAQRRLIECALYRRHQALRITLQDVVDRTALQGLDGALLADGAREEDERHPGCLGARNGQCRHAVESGEAEIGQDEIGRARAQRAAHLGLVHHALEGACVAALLQAPPGQLGVRRGILDQQDSQRPAGRLLRGRIHRHVSDLAYIRRAPGTESAEAGRWRERAHTGVFQQPIASLLDPPERRLTRMAVTLSGRKTGRLGG